MGRKILFITTDQQRFDSLGCNGGTVARTPVIDGLAASGINYKRAQPSNVVCMPSRATMVTGQSISTHGVWMNGVPLPANAPSVAAWLADQAGYRTALFGKAHFEPFMDPARQFTENRLAGEGGFGPHRGFEHMEMAAHSPLGLLHYAAWMRNEHAGEIVGFFPVLDDRLQVNAAGGGDTGAPQVAINTIPRDHYHTDWVADRAIAWLDSLDADDDWFCWVSFPDPHHPWDPPASELHRVRWQDLDLPPGYPTTAAEREAIIDGKPRHWRLWYDGDVVANFEAPPDWVPATLTADQVREINALVHIENELIDEACGRVLRRIEERGWRADTDVIFTTDHGELQGDYGLLFKGPYHVDALMRLPLIWSPAPNAAPAAEVVDRPVGLIDLAPTFCEIAGVPIPGWMEGAPLPASNAAADTQGRQRVLTEWDSQHARGDVHLRTITRDGWVCTIYLPGTFHDGSEGELYSLSDDPMQRHNLWDDPARRSVRDDLVDDLLASLPAERHPLEAVAPV
jgi:arylsulfatase A-like enzyme